jgi:hypothetical protein
MKTMPSLSLDGVEAHASSRYMARSNSPSQERLVREDFLLTQRRRGLREFVVADNHAGLRSATRS